MIATVSNFAEHDDNQWQEPNSSATDILHQQGWTDPICYSSGSDYDRCSAFESFARVFRLERI